MNELVTSYVKTPIRKLRDIRRPRAFWFTTYPRRDAADKMRARVASDAFILLVRPLKTTDTNARDTPTASLTSCMVIWLDILIFPKMVRLIE